MTGGSPPSQGAGHGGPGGALPVFFWTSDLRHEIQGPRKLKVEETD